MKKLLLFLILITGCQKNDYFKQYEYDKIQVTINGEIIKPGTYELKYPSTLADLIQLAGGLTIDADSTTFQQSMMLKDLDTITIYKKDSNKININTANSTLLMTLNGVGKTLANRIISYRNENGAFKSLYDLTKVKGMNENKLSKIIEHLKLSE